MSYRKEDHKDMPPEGHCGRCKFSTYYPGKRVTMIDPEEPAEWSCDNPDVPGSIEILYPPEERYKYCGRYEE